ncbi:hypothetical protein H100_06066 [Trichophyton rubrum MR850]|nr:hypothetical protein H100_06066 [Trichophyton rubrum MR850]
MALQQGDVPGQGLNGLGQGLGHSKIKRVKNTNGRKTKGQVLEVLEVFCDSTEKKKKKKKKKSYKIELKDQPFSILKKRPPPRLVLIVAGRHYRRKRASDSTVPNFLLEGRGEQD